ncbi:methyltransferase domain-containing protein [Amycolatopsis keratiniphila]|uniref:SAM-dependent methyltransferase n=1 Tax=Amycolatopsis keratiniphila subsp. keratiniphila TaxID=227715 RepID=A0A1W2M2P3_9PSEU|nr:methyltransferase domain-containing protein [Amycolatopsis keratiniphila]ONF74307.1 SAM-dependent methyltransferase [Amycolatopsis keratiniphila subsp. keratiniphila]
MSMMQRLDAADALPGAAELRARTYELLRLDPGSAVIDVGCGAGLAVSELSARGFRAVGVDLSEEMIDEARRRWPERDFLLGDAYALPVDGGFAGYRADKVFHELAEPELALAEARRVLVPGGRIVLSGPDWEGLMIDSSYPALTREIVRARASVIAAPRIARGLRRLLTECGFRDVSVEGVIGFLGGESFFRGLVEVAVRVGSISVEEGEIWLAEQVDVVAVPQFLASGVV